MQNFQWNPDNLLRFWGTLTCWKNRVLNAYRKGFFVIILPLWYKSHLKKCKRLKTKLKIKKKMTFFFQLLYYFIFVLLLFFFWYHTKLFMFHIHVFRVLCHFFVEILYFVNDNPCLFFFCGNEMQLCQYLLCCDQRCLWDVPFVLLSLSTDLLISMNYFFLCCRVTVYLPVSLPFSK